MPSQDVIGGMGAERQTTGSSRTRRSTKGRLLSEELWKGFGRSATGKAGALSSATTRIPASRTSQNAADSVMLTNLRQTWKEMPIRDSHIPHGGDTETRGAGGSGGLSRTGR